MTARRLTFALAPLAGILWGCTFAYGGGWVASALVVTGVWMLCVAGLAMGERA